LTHEQTAEDIVFELSGYVLNCAEMALSPRGSPRYSALRFIQVFNRIANLFEQVECIKKDDFLQGIQEKLSKVPIERDKTEETRKGIQALLVEYAVEANNRIE
jgi:hypothetical protein